MGDELNSHVADRRQRSCQVIGKMASKRDSIILRDYSMLYKEYLARFMDKSAEVRIVAIETACKIIKNVNESSEAYQQLVSCLVTSALDLDPKVRLKFV